MGNPNPNLNSNPNSNPDHHPNPNQASSDAQWGGLAQRLLERGAHAGAPQQRGGVDAGDHPPITPVLGADGGLPGGGDGRRIYELVTLTR